MNVTDLKHEKSVIFRDWQELHWNVIWVHELSPPQYHLSKRTDAFPNLSGSWSTAALTVIPTRRPIAHQRSQYWNYNLFSSYISSLLSRNIDQAKTLAKWKAFTLKIYSLCNNIRPEIQYKRLQSTFFFLYTSMVFQWDAASQTTPKFIFENDFRTGTWKISVLVPHPNDPSSDWSKSKQKGKKKTSTLGKGHSWQPQQHDCSETKL